MKTPPVYALLTEKNTEPQRKLFIFSDSSWKNDWDHGKNIAQLDNMITTLPQTHPKMVIAILTCNCYIILTIYLPITPWQLLAQ
jgi:hypothetical protein